MAEFRPHVAGLKEAGIEVAVIGSGAPNFARGFQERMNVPELSIYSDEKLASYAAAGMERSWLSIVDPRAIWKGIGSLKRHPQKRVMGDASQQGGVVIVKPDGTIAWRQVSRYAGDHAPNEQIVDEALKAAR